MILIHFSLTLFMTGLIWIIQVVHYPSMRFLDVKLWEEAHEQHVKYISMIVVPIMILELLTAVYVLYHSAMFLYWVNFVLLIIIWLSTFLLQIPRHKRLLKDYNLKYLNHLIKWNWIRTISWTARAALLFFILVK